MAYFDIYPSSNSASFNGAWNNYPFFASGNVIVSGMEQGLFVLRPKLNTDFTLSTDDPVLAACLPGERLDDLHPHAANGYTGTVNMSAAGLPAGASDVFNPNPAAVPGTTDADRHRHRRRPGDLSLHGTATDGVHTHQMDLTLHVANAAPGSPSSTSPPNGAFNLPVQPVFTWEPAAQAATYDIQIATDPAFNNIVSQATGLAAPTFTPPFPLTPNTTHYWRVRAVNGCGIGAYSTVFSFTTTAPAGSCPLGTRATPLATEGVRDRGPRLDLERHRQHLVALERAGAHRPRSRSTPPLPASVTDQRLTSPPIALPSGQMPLSMQFWNYQNIESQTRTRTEHLLGCWDGAHRRDLDRRRLHLDAAPEHGDADRPYDGAVDGTSGNPLAGAGRVVRGAAALAELRGGRRGLRRPDRAVPFPAGNRRRGGHRGLVRGRLPRPVLRGPDARTWRSTTSRWTRSTRRHRTIRPRPSSP